MKAGIAVMEGQIHINGHGEDGSILMATVLQWEVYNEFPEEWRFFIATKGGGSQ